MRTCAITGHRPARFRFKYDEGHEDCKMLKERIRAQLVRLYKNDVRKFYVGGAQGVDLWTGELLLLLREQGCADIELMLALPFEGYDTMWDAQTRNRMAVLKRASKQCVVVGDSNVPPATNYRRRNEYMVDRCDILLAIYDNDRTSRSGTGMTVRYAERKGLPILLVHPDTGKAYINRKL